ncbi:MAG: methyltransferase [Polyangiaceae bacterium]
MRTGPTLRTTEDALFGGKVRLFQPAPGAGYRTNVDALLLAAFAGGARRSARIAVDLGAGVGAVGFSLLHLGIAERIEFVEREPPIAELCERNIAANGASRRAAVHVGDLARPLRAIAPTLVHAASLVVANPPYVAEGRDGRAARDPRTALRQRARHGDLLPFVRAAAEALGKRGRACFVYPAHAALDLMLLARGKGLEPKRLRFVHGKRDRPARVVLLELANAKPGGLVVETPLIETGDDGRPSAEVAELLAR